MPAYFPPPDTSEDPRGDWQRRDPADAGFDPSRLAAAVQYAIDSEIGPPQWKQSKERPRERP